VQGKCPTGRWGDILGGLENVDVLGFARMPGLPRLHLIGDPSGISEHRQIVTIATIISWCQADEIFNESSGSNGVSKQETMPNPSGTLDSMSVTGIAATSAHR
jgi:hypothetical protein